MAICRNLTVFENWPQMVGPDLVLTNNIVRTMKTNLKMHHFFKSKGINKNSTF